MVSLVIVHYTIEKQNDKYFLGRVEGKDGEENSVSFMKQTFAAGFTWPEQKGSDNVTDSQIIDILPETAWLIG